MPVILASPKQAVLLDQARIMKIEIESNLCKHGLDANHMYIDIYVVWGRDVDGSFAEHIDPETTAVAQYFRISDGMNPHARPALPGVNPASDGPPLGKCDNAECEAWQDRGIGETCPDCKAGKVQPYDGFSRLAAALAAGVPELVKDATVLFREEAGALDAFAAGGTALSDALDAFAVSPAFLARAFDADEGCHMHNVISRTLYGFLTSEIVPDPVFGTEKALLEAAS